MSSSIKVNKITPNKLRLFKQESKKITMLTAYDYPTACLLEEAGIDVVLIGDSVGTVLYGLPDTLSVTLEQILLHTQAVHRGIKSSLVVADMPFMTYQVSKEQALINAGRLMKEAGAHAVKLEGGKDFAETVAFLVRAGVPVMGHIGLMPQSLHKDGGYRMHGKSDQEAKALVDSALLLEEAGAFAVVLECVEAGCAQAITKTLKIPTIGIGSGSDCDGQVLVTQDLLGLTQGAVPKFVQPEANLKVQAVKAINAFKERVLKS